ncbi:hypothetical protein BDQ12DRAFT_724027 [Crucibulum laeve]|uniref:Pali-domain-containing protein n=1 Tax=Crucibulum laeve TaxID=68775 RepID=A0A5C3LYT4_9AGAR|nr:hypothetical protein BDQ12DRAFT_724027 [Crucibulum laeve]
MSRAFCIPGIVILFIALVLSFLTSISLPFLPALDITRAHVGTKGSVQDGAAGITEIRLGVWAPCYYDTNGARTCLKTGHGYSFQVSNQDKTKTVTVGSSWTRGLAVHPVATAVTALALAFSFSTHITVTLIASLLSFLAALITLIAFAIDIALFAFLKHQLNNLEIGAKTLTGPGFWLTFVTFILLLIAGCTVCFGRRRDRLSGATTSYSTSKRPFWSRFRRN